MTTRHTQYLLYFIFGLSGFSGLIYESIWSHYLKLFLGHAAYAQALVLIIFMGGMAIGAWLASRRSNFFRNPLLIYALIEGIIGTFGLLFHTLFQSILTYSFESIIPSLDNPHYVQLYKFTVASLLILPQSILLGATFPLMSGGFIRKFPDTPGKSISLLYFVNSTGAAIALLSSAFYLIGKLGLPGTITAAGLLNIIIAIIVYVLVRRPCLLYLDTSGTVHRTGNWPWVFLSAAFFTGMASFIYEVAWIRMLSMVLGASTHSFELMLSAFITGIAIGGYLIGKKIDTLEDPIRLAGLVQIIMGFFAFATILLYDYSFDVMTFFMTALDNTESGYSVFSLASHSIALLIMLPATICAGMTLPLFTFILFRRGQGEKSIGQIYSANTIGAILGVVFTVFIGMPVLGLKGAIMTGALIDIIIGVVLLRSFAATPKVKYSIVLTAICLGLFVSTAAFYDFNTKRMSSGVFRYEATELDEKSEIIFHQDGKTASVAVSNWDGKQIAISTNGKVDAAITMSDTLSPTWDETTTILLAALPISIYPDAKIIANVGLGSGLTSHTALAWPGVERVDTIEIEEAMVRGAQYFHSRTGRAFDDPRSHLHIDDARTYFLTYQQKYDIIISEPSNPWVSGVAGLFTKEFYGIARKALEDDGIFVQWIHIYEFNFELLASVLKALSMEFDYYSVYFADGGNLILLASPASPINYPDASVFDSPEIKEILSSINVLNIEDLRFRFLGDQDIYNPYLNNFEVAANSDYQPFVDLNAVKARFLREDISEILNIRLSSVPILEILYGNRNHRIHNLSLTEYYPYEHASVANKIYQYLLNGHIDKSIIESITNVNYLRAASKVCPPDYNEILWGESLYMVASQISYYLTTEQMDQITLAILPTCEQTELSDYMTNWSAFFTSISKGNIINMIAASKKLLATGVDLNVDQKKYLSVSLLAGLIKTGEYDQAVFLWREYMTDLYSPADEHPLELRVLLSIIGQRN